jgi:hypothetical protein
LREKTDFRSSKIDFTQKSEKKDIHINIPIFKETFGNMFLDCLHSTLHWEYVELEHELWEHVALEGELWEHDDELSDSPHHVRGVPPSQELALF